MSGENAGGGISISAANGRKNVKPVEAGSSDDEAGVDIVFPPDYLHAASGPVVAKAGRHAPAAMPLMPAPACSSQANTQAALRNHGIEAKGSFHLNRVPEGRYLPGLTSAGDTEGPAAPTPAAIRSTRGTPQEVHHKRYITRGTSQEVHHKRYITRGTPGARNPVGKPSCPSPSRAMPAGRYSRFPVRGHNLCRVQKPRHSRRCPTNRGPFRGHNPAPQ
jgi:hypothetical protein